MEIVWETPRPAALARAQGGNGRYRQFAQALRDNPEKWAVLPTDSANEKTLKSTAASIRRGAVKGFTKDEFETLVDMEAPGGPKVYVRFMPTLQVEKNPAPPAAPAEPGAPVDPEVAPPAPERPVPTEDDAPQPAEVRAWARRNGFDVPDRGRMPQAVHDAYRAYLTEALTAIGAADEVLAEREAPARALSSVPAPQ